MGHRKQKEKSNESKTKEPTVKELFTRFKELTDIIDGINGDLPIIVFGPCPGIVSDITVGMKGNITFIYRALTSKEMGNDGTRL